MIRISLRTLQGYRTPILLIGLGLYAFALLLAYIFQAFGGAEGMMRYMEMMPESMQRIAEAEGFTSDTYMGYLAGGYRHPVFLISIAAFVIGTGSRVVAGEVERGTILLVLSRPLMRWQFLSGKYFAIFSGLIFVLLFAWAGTWTGTLLTGEGAKTDHLVLLRVTINAIVLALAIGGYTAFISSFNNDGGQATGQATAVTVVMFFLDYLATLWDAASFLGPVSIFHYYNPVALADGGGNPLRDISVLLSIAVIAYAFAYYYFQRRDIAR